MTLIGFPIKEYELKKDDINQWVSHDLMHVYLSTGWDITGKSRMGYAIPSWVPKGGKDSILLLDDWTRADPRMIQSVMELIDRGQALSWSLPSNCTIVLSSNPDNGDYSVASIDNATKTRYVSFTLDFDKDIWAKWAEEEGIDTRCINFLLSYPEILKKEGDIQTVNPRSLVTFFNTISGFKNFSDTKTLALILNIAKGCFTSKDNIVGNLFTQFINNKLDKLISPENMLHKKWDVVKDELSSILYDEENYRADIASVLATRFCNYTSIYFNKPGAKSEVVCDRILDIIDSEKTLLSEDLIFNLIKTLRMYHPTRTNKLMLNPKIIKKLL